MIIKSDRRITESRKSNTVKTEKKQSGNACTHGTIYHLHKCILFNTNKAVNNVMQLQYLTVLQAHCSNVHSYVHS